MSVGQFIHILRSRLHLSPGKALFVFVNDTLPQTGIKKKKMIKLFMLLSLKSYCLSIWNILLLWYDDFLNSTVICSYFNGFGLWIFQGWGWIFIHVLQHREDLWRDGQISFRFLNNDSMHITNFKKWRGLFACKLYFICVIWTHLYYKRLTFNHIYVTYFMKDAPIH